MLSVSIWISSKSPPVQVEVKELVVELEHAELRQLVDHDADLEWPVDVYLNLSPLNLVSGSDLLEGLEPGRTETLVNLLLVTGVNGVGVTLHGFDELAVGTVAQQLENLGKKSLVFLSVTLAPVIRHLVHEPAEDLAGPVVDGSVHRREFQTLVEIPSQEGSVTAGSSLPTSHPKVSSAPGNVCDRSVASSRACAAVPHCRELRG